MTGGTLREVQEVKAILDRLDRFYANPQPGLATWCIAVGNALHDLSKATEKAMTDRCVVEVGALPSGPDAEARLRALLKDAHVMLMKSLDRVSREAIPDWFERVRAIEREIEQ